MPDMPGSTTTASCVLSVVIVIMGVAEARWAKPLRQSGKQPLQNLQVVSSLQSTNHMISIITKAQISYDMISIITCLLSTKLSEHKEGHQFSHL